MRKLFSLFIGIMFFTVMSTAQQVPSDGELDVTFAPSSYDEVLEMIDLPDSTILVRSTSGIRHIDYDGNLIEELYTNTNPVVSLSVDMDTLFNKTISINSTNQWFVKMIDLSGNIDWTYEVNDFTMNAAMDSTWQNRYTFRHLATQGQDLIVSGYDDEYFSDNYGNSSNTIRYFIFFIYIDYL